MNKTRLNVLAVAIGLAASITTTSATAEVTYYNWDGFFTLLWTDGTLLSNSSITGASVNQYQTPITGTLAFDANTGAGLVNLSASIGSFDFFGGTVQLHDISLQAIGDGFGGAGTLVIGNMLADWIDNSNMPVSTVWDAAGLFNGIANGDLNDGVLDQTDVASYGAVPASDGTYADATWGYLDLGPVPIATTEWNTTTSCAPGVDCIGDATSGVLPLVTDTAINTAEYASGDGVGIGGSPMVDSPFGPINPNFDITRLEYAGTDPNLHIAAFNQVLNLAPVPVPAAIWLFGSGLLVLAGATRGKRTC